MQDRLIAGKVRAHALLEDYMVQKKSYLNVYLGTVKEPWVDYCNTLGKKPGAAIKEAIEQQLAKAEANSQPKTYRQTESVKEPKERFEILLTTSEQRPSKIGQALNAVQCAAGLSMRSEQGSRMNHSSACWKSTP